MTARTFIHRYPVFIQGRHPRNKTVRGAVLIKEGEIGVPVIDGSDAPVAATIRTHLRLMGCETLVTSEFRHFDGAFYTMSQLHPRDLVATFYDPFSTWGHRRKFVSDVHVKTKNEPCWPKDIWEQFDNTDNRHPSGELCVRESGMIIVEPGQEDILRKQQERAEAMTGYFAVIDGRLWERSHEPAYKISAAQRKLGIVTYDPDACEWKMGSEAADAYFSLLDRDRASTVFDTYCGGNRKGWPEVDIHMPEAFVTDHAPHTFREFARCLAKKARYGHGQGPIDQRVALLEQLTKNAPIDEVDFSALESVIVQLAEDHRRLGVFADVETAAINQQVDLWDSRTVELQHLHAFGTAP